MSMNRKKYGFVALLLAAIAVISLGATNIYVNHNRSENEGEKLRIVTSFYPMYIATMNIVDGCDSVILENLSEPQTGCLHDYQLTPEDMVLISKADVLIINGGGIENFIEDIAEKYPNLTIIEAGAGINMQGENAHMWMNMEDYQRQVENIATGLIKATAGMVHNHSHDQEHNHEEEESLAEHFKENADAYCDKIQKLAEDYVDIRDYAGEKVILFHEAYEYVAGEWGFDDVYTLNLDEERQVSAGEIADVLEAVKEDGVKFILAEELYGEETAKSIQKEADVEVLYLDTCVRGEYEKDSYLEAMENNLKLLQEALTTP